MGMQGNTLWHVRMQPTQRFDAGDRHLKEAPLPLHYRTTETGRHQKGTNPYDKHQLQVSHLQQDMHFICI
jgi:hypothetical protein